jgi:site-specific recombinase XerD
MLTAKLQPRTDFRAALEAFLLSRRVSNCSARTVSGYAWTLQRFAQALGPGDLWQVSSLGIQRYIAGLREIMKPVSVHHHFRALKTFSDGVSTLAFSQRRLCAAWRCGCLGSCRGVPEDQDVRQLLQTCTQTFEGRRNRALVALLADSGLRISEAVRLRIEDVSFSARTLNIRGGEGGKDGVGFFGAETAHLLKVWLAARAEAVLEDYVFVDRLRRSLTCCHVLMARTFRSHAVPLDRDEVRSPSEPQPSRGAPVRSQVTESKNG